MKINSMGRHIREGLKSIWRNGWMSFASVSSVMFTLVILGMSLVIAVNAQQMSGSVLSQLEIEAYLTGSTTTVQSQVLAGQVESLQGVKSVQLITKEQGLKEFEAKLDSQYRDVLAGLPQNPIPNTLVIKATDPRETASLASEVSRLPGVQNVKYGQAFINPLFSALDAIRDVGLVFVIALLITAMFLISNTIKITIFSRRREIEIMKLVGATNWFIRWPFLIEGMLIGIVGALVPYVLISVGYHMVYRHVGGEIMGLSFPLASATAVAFKLAFVMFGIGIFIGIWGGIMSVRKFLRI